MRRLDKGRRAYIALSLLFLHSILFAQQEDSEATWREALGGKVLSIPASQAESVVVVTDDRTLRCYSSSGRLLWQFDAKGKLAPFVSRSREGTSYICRQDGTFTAINRSGRMLWTKKLPGPMIAEPLIGWDGRVFIPLEWEIVCISAAGDQRWNLRFEAPLALPPVPDGNGGILVALRSNQVLNISRVGQVRSAAVPEQPVVLTDSDDSDGTGPGFIVYYRNGSGESRNFSGGTRHLPQVSGLPVAASRNGTLLAVLLESGQVVAISLENQRTLWEGYGPGKAAGESLAFPISGKTNTRPFLLFDERGIYAQRLSGAAGFTIDGRRLWAITIQGAASSPSFSDEGILYSGGNDWILYAYKLEDRVRSIAHQMYGPEPEGLYHLETLTDPLLSTDPFLFEESVMTAHLERIEALINDGNVATEEPACLSLLMRIASAGQQSRGLPFQLQPTVQPYYRVWAIRLLARLGSRETIPFLTRLASNEQDSLVVSEIATAIGHIGVDPEGLALQTFDALLHSPLYRQDERVLVSIAQSIEALCRFSGPPLSEAGIPYLIELAEIDRVPVVRTTAQRALERMMD